jgi:hypothetical protein
MIDLERHGAIALVRMNAPQEFAFHVAPNGRNLLGARCARR